jgi:hypothetical protein
MAHVKLFGSDTKEEQIQAMVDYAKTSPATIQKTILTPYQSLLKRIDGLNRGGSVYNSAQCLLQLLEPYVTSSNELQDIEELLEKFRVR